MSEWREYKLGDVADVTSSKRIFYSEYVDNGIPFYRSKEIIDLFNRRTIQNELYISEQRFNEIKNKFGVPEEDDILLTSVGSLGIPYRVKKGDKFYFKDGNLTWFRKIDKTLVKPEFLYIWLASSVGKQKLDEITIGSTQSALTISGLKSIDIILPNISIQTAIASVLSSLDDKIDLLHRQNETLEKMAETLFRQWFVEEAEEDWEEVKLNQIVDVYNGVSYKSIDLNPSTTAMVTLKSFNRNGGFQMSGFKEFTGNYRKHHIIRSGEIAIAHTDMTQNAEVVGNPIIIPNNHPYKTLLVSMDLVKVLSKDKNIYSNEFLYLLFKHKDFKEHALEYTNGSTVLHLSKKAIPEYITNLPGNEIIIEFTKLVRPLFEKQSINQTQIRTLTQLRDTLLPKLMNGEVRVDF